MTIPSYYSRSFGPQAAVALIESHQVGKKTLALVLYISFRNFTLSCFST